MTLSRRDFLLGSTALAVVAALPVDSTEIEYTWKSYSVRLDVPDDLAALLERRVKKAQEVMVKHISKDLFG